MNGESEAAFSSDQRFGEWVVAKAARRFDTHEHDIDSLMTFEGASALGILEFAGLGMASNRRIVVCSEVFAARFYVSEAGLWKNMTSARRKKNRWQLQIQRWNLLFKKSWSHEHKISFWIIKLLQSQKIKLLNHCSCLGLSGFLTSPIVYILFGWDHGFKVTLVGEGPWR